MRKTEGSGEEEEVVVVVVFVVSTSGDSAPGEVRVAFGAICNTTRDTVVCIFCCILYTTYADLVSAQLPALWT